ncbi:MAG TPA: helix-turn-helix domain-containing protein [Mycobacteriales bacterium]|nr:helix-turn-helix domain-containing protein [Mycobacteriales bacterium]
MAEPSGAERSSGGKRPGRPPKLTDPTGSAVAALGAELRRLRVDRGLTLAQLGRLVGYSWQHLGAVERGTAVPSETVVLACDAAVLANGRLVAMLSAVIREQARVRHQHEAARRPARRADPVGAKARLVCGQGDLDWERLADATRRPSRLNAQVVDDLELITDRQRRLYHELSSAEMMVHVQAQVGLLVSLLDSPQPDLLRHRVASAAAEAAGFAAWLWYDLGDLYTMDHCYRQAALAADESGDTGLRSYILGYRGLVARAYGQSETALGFLDQARQTAARSVSDPTRSWLAVLAADALARVDRRHEAVAALDDARSLLAGRADRTDAWMYEFDEGSLAVHAGTCLLALGRSQGAVEAFSDALRLLPASCERRGAEIQVGLAAARLAGGEVEEAQRLAIDSLTTFATRGSVAGLRRVRELRDTFRTGGHLGAAAAVDERARALETVPA